MSDIVSLGLDISSFDDGKLAKLQEYITLFEKLEKYDGKKINPVLGEGLTAFNSSVAETTKLVEDLNIRLGSLATAQTNVNATSSTSASSNKNNTNSLSAKSNAVIKAAEAETRLATANVKSAQSLLSKASAEARAASSALDNAKKKERDVLTAKSEEAAQKAVSAALAVRVNAERQLLAANNQLSITEIELAKATGLAANEQQRLQTAVNNSKIAVVSANTAVQQSGAAVASTTQQLAVATQSSGNFGKALNSAFGSLRTLAYILPGIGLAGLFNLAFEALGPVISGLASMVNGVHDVAAANKLALQIETQVNKSLEERIGLYRELLSIQEQYYLDYTKGSSKQLQLEIENKGTRGVNQNKLLPLELDETKKKFEEVKGQIVDFFALVSGDRGLAQQGSNLSRIDLLKKSLSDLQPTIAKTTKDVAALSLQLAGKNIFSGVKVDEEKTKTKLEASKALLELQKSQYSAGNKLLLDYYNSENDITKKQEQIKKFNEDEARKLSVETRKSNNEKDISLSKIEFEKEIASQKRKQSELLEQRNAKSNINKASLDNVTGNNTSTDAEVKIAQNKFKNESIENEADYQKKLFELNESYRQRLLKAQTEIDKLQIESEALKNEKIFNNTEKNLEDRIVAYSNYINLKQSLQDKEYLKDKERLTLKANDPTARKELEELEAGRVQQRLSIQADNEKKVFDIVSTSLKKQFDEVKRLNDLDITENERLYTIEVQKLNESYKNKTISFAEYKKANERVDKEFKVKKDQQNITDDKQDIERFEDLLNKQKGLLEKANQKVNTAEVFLQSAKDSGGDVNNAQGNLDKAKGEQAGIQKAIEDANQAIANGNEKLAKDILKKALDERDQMALIEDQKQKKRKQTVDYIMKIEKALYDAIKKNSDARYKIDSDKIKEKIQIVNEGYDGEIAAIERSSLSQKDKAALDIQLNEQKKEANKAAAVEQKRLDIEKAEFDKQLSIAHIIFGTAEAVINAGAITPQAVAAGIIGAIQLAAAIATPIPSFAEGVEDFKGGMARYGEAGAEVVKEPYKAPYIVDRETISYLPKGTDIIPLIASPIFDNKIKDTSWEQTMFLANQIKKSNTKVINNNNINIDLGFTNYKRQILGN